MRRKHHGKTLELRGHSPGAGAQLQPHAGELHGQVLALAWLRLVHCPRKLRSARSTQPCGSSVTCFFQLSHNAAIQVPPYVGSMSQITIARCTKEVPFPFLEPTWQRLEPARLHSTYPELMHSHLAS